METIKAFGAKALVTLMSDTEREALRVSPRQLRDKASVLGVEWLQLAFGAKEFRMKVLSNCGQPEDGVFMSYSRK